MPKGRPKSPLADRFWSKVDRSGGSTSCWPWQGKRARAGYGVFSDVEHGHTRYLRAHRVAFQLEHARAPVDCLLHRCDNPPCCNPLHLFEGSRADNVADCIAKGRARRGRNRGTMNGKAKLTPEQVHDLRTSKTRGESYNALATRFGIRKGSVANIVAGRTWRHLL